MVLMWSLKFLFRIPHKPPAGSLRVLHASARRGWIRRASKTKINNLGIDELLATRHFQKFGSISGGNDGFKKIENLEFKTKF
jgi:hypothetical protein